MRARGHDLWIGTDGGLVVFNTKTYESVFYPLPTNVSVESSAVRSLVLDRQDFMWAATYNGGIYTFETETMSFNKHYTTQNGLCHNRVYKLHIDTKGKLRAGTLAGLSVYEVAADTFACVPRTTKEMVIDIHEQPNHSIWLATYGHGLISMQDTVFLRITKAHGLVDNATYAVLPDTRGHLWISTNRGLTRYNPVKGVFTNFDTEDGLQSREFNAGSAFVSAQDGEMFFGGINGFNSFYPDKIKPHTYQAPIYITNLKKFGKPVETDSALYAKRSELVLDYTDNFITIEYTSLNFSDATQTGYSYRLSGLEKKWVNAHNQTSASYTNLPPGRYTFEVKATNSDGITVSEPARLMLYIKPPFYKEPWFVWLTGSFSLIAIVGLYGYRLQNIKKKNQNLERIIKNRTKEVYIKNIQISDQREQIEEERNKVQQTNEELNIALTQIREQAEVLSYKNEQVAESLSYAALMQQSLLQPEEELKQIWPESFVLNLPRDSVSGDFFWIREVEKVTIIAVADCTGHGVPGAMVSILGHKMLDDIISNEAHNYSPAYIFRSLDKHIKAATGSGEVGRRSGMEAGICVINQKQKTLCFCGAMRPLVIVKDNALTETVTPDRFSVGIDRTENEQKTFTNQTIPWVAGAWYYLFSDGYADQFGGKNSRKMMNKRFYSILQTAAGQPPENQKFYLYKELKDWQQNEPQVDDILVLGFTVGK